MNNAPSNSPAEILTRELKQASEEHAVWNLTVELQRVYGPQAARISVMASPLSDTGKLSADTLRVLDEDFETLLPDLNILKLACQIDADLRDNLDGLAELSDPERYTETDEDLGDHVLSSPVFVDLKRAVDTWLLFARPPERPGWPQQLELTNENHRQVILLSSKGLQNMTVAEFVSLKRQLLK